MTAFYDFYYKEFYVYHRSVHYCFFFLYNKLYSNNTKMYNVHLTKNDISNNDVNNGVVKDYRPAI